MLDGVAVELIAAETVDATGIATIGDAVVTVAFTFDVVLDTLVSLPSANEKFPIDDGAALSGAAAAAEITGVLDTFGLSIFVELITVDVGAKLLLKFSESNLKPLDVVDCTAIVFDGTGCAALDVNTAFVEIADVTLAFSLLATNPNGLFGSLNSPNGLCVGFDSVAEFAVLPNENIDGLATFESLVGVRLPNGDGLLNDVLLNDGNAAVVDTFGIDAVKLSAFEPMAAELNGMDGLFVNGTGSGFFSTIFSIVCGVDSNGLSVGGVCSSECRVTFSAGFANDMGVAVVAAGKLNDGFGRLPNGIGVLVIGNAFVTGAG